MAEIPVPKMAPAGGSHVAKGQRGDGASQVTLTRDEMVAAPTRARAHRAVLEADGNSLASVCLLALEQNMLRGGGKGLGWGHWHRGTWPQKLHGFVSCSLFFFFFCLQSSLCNSF